MLVAPGASDTVDVPEKIGTHLGVPRLFAARHADHAEARARRGDAPAPEAVAAGLKPIISSRFDPQQGREAGQPSHEAPARQLQQHAGHGRCRRPAASRCVEHPGRMLDITAAEPELSAQVGSLIRQGQHPVGRVPTGDPIGGARSHASPPVEDEQQRPPTEPRLQRRLVERQAGRCRPRGPHDHPPPAHGW